MSAAVSSAGEFIEVVAAVVARAGSVLLCQRHDTPHLPLLWEFPGGKVDDGETPQAALERELREELGVDSVVARQIADIRHRYSEKRVRIRFYVAHIDGEPRAIVHRELRWVPVDELRDYEVPPANAPVVRMLIGFGPDKLSDLLGPPAGHARGPLR